MTDQLRRDLARNLSDYYTLMAAAKGTLPEEVVQGYQRLGPGMPIDENTPKDRPILAWCDHNADPGREKNANGGWSLSLYAAHAEGMSFAEDGFNVLVWGGAFDDSSYEDFHQAASLPDWWFVKDSEFERAANPTRWWPLPEDQALTPEPIDLDDSEDETRL